MKKMVNRTVVEGYLYNNSLEEKTYSENAKRPGAKYIMGTVEIATDDAQTNIVPVYFSFVSEPEADAKPVMKSRYETLVNIMNGNIKSIMKDGKENAAKLQISSAIGVNDFYSDRNGSLELVSAKRNEGGFIRSQSALNDESMRNTFEVDIVITNVRHVEADDERNLPEKAIVGGYIFDFRNAIMPVEFSVNSPGAMNYFESLGVSRSNPFFTKVSGHQMSATVNRTIVKESAFGEDSVRIVKDTRKEWIIDWAQKEEYEFGEDTLTNEEIKSALADREIMLADRKSRAMNRNNAISEPAKSNTNYSVKKSDSTFDF